MKDKGKSVLYMMSEQEAISIRDKIANDWVDKHCRKHGCVFARMKGGTVYCSARPPEEVLHAFREIVNRGCDISAVNAGRRGWVEPGNMSHKGFTGKGYELPISHHIRNIWNNSKKSN